MKYYGMLFNGEMVRAILRKENPKTQTRRVLNKIGRINGQTFKDVHDFTKSLTPGYDWMFLANGGTWNEVTHDELMQAMPYGVGDRIYVRETCRLWCVDGTGTTDDGYWMAKYQADGHTGFIKDESGWRVGWDGDESPIEIGCHEEPAKWRPSIHMPRWAARIFLEVEEVRIERVQDINHEDIKAEGCWLATHPQGLYMMDDLSYYPGDYDAFGNYWDSIAKPGETWDDNPWVRVTRFRRVEDV